MISKAAFLAIAAGALIGSAALAQSDTAGSCDSGAQREKRSLEFIVETRADTASSFVARRPCTNEQIVIPQCAVLAIHTRKSQHYCIGTGRPDYSDEVSFIDYWEIPGKEPSTR